MNKLPRIGITMGDPAGVGPEIIVKVCSKEKVRDICSLVILGDRGLLFKTSKEMGTGTSFHIIEVPSQASEGDVNIIPLSDFRENSIEPGRPCHEGNIAMANYIVEGVRMASRGELDAIVTCPISKVGLHDAGYDFQGHTQMIAHITKTPDYVMMLAGDRLRVCLATIHCALKDVPGLLRAEGIIKTISVTWLALRRDFGIERPKVAVAALNPHAGESGLFGNEEDLIIRPAIESAIKKGIHVEGPLPADTVFWKASQGDYDAVVAMYHDQGLGPFKTIHFSDGVNVTLGLPIIRTSVDHGTAYDIAGKGIADASSLEAAISMAAMMVRNRKRWDEANG